MLIVLCFRSTQVLEVSKKGMEVVNKGENPFTRLKKKKKKILFSFSRFEGSPEIMVLEVLPKDGTEMTREDVEKALGAELFKAGLGLCGKNKWVKATKTTVARAEGLKDVKDEVREDLEKLKNGGKRKRERKRVRERKTCEELERERE